MSQLLLFVGANAVIGNAHTGEGQIDMIFIDERRSNGRESVIGDVFF